MWVFGSLAYLLPAMVIVVRLTRSNDGTTFALR